MLLAGAVAVAVGFYLLYVLQVAAHGAPRDWSWDFDAGSVEVGGGTRSTRGWLLRSDDTGRAVLVIPIPSLEASRYPLLHLRFSEKQAATTLGVFWRTAQTGEQMAQYWIPGTVNKSVWLPMAGFDAWTGDLVEIAILVKGAPGAEHTLEAFELLSGSPGNRIKAFYSDWIAFVPWRLSSINSFESTRSSGATLYPVVLAATLLAASVLAYGVLLISCRGMHPDRRVLACIFLFCWVGLDLVWQRKLWLQLELTHSAFSGKDNMAKLEAGPDAALVQFMTYVRKRATPAASRIFVGSRNDYAGMRGSYYLYPRNVYWQRDSEELPDREYIDPGDYIVLIHPTEVRFDPQRSALLPPGQGSIKVRLLAEAGVGDLYRVL